MSQATGMFLVLDRFEGGQVMVPLDEIGIVSSDLRNTAGPEQTPAWTLDTTHSLVHVKCIGINIIVNHSVDEIMGLLEAYRG